MMCAPRFVKFKRAKYNTASFARYAITTGILEMQRAGHHALAFTITQTLPYALQIF
jgi:hypothetical protein